MEVLKMEGRRLMRSKSLAISLLAGLVIVLLQFSYFYTNTYRINQGWRNYVLGASYGDSAYGDWYENGILEGWLGCETFSPYNQLFFLILPLLAALPFGISLHSDWKSGYAAQIITRCGRRRYFSAKFAATFVGGGAAVAIPLLLSLLITACFVPAIGSDPLAMQSVVRQNDMLGGLYYEHPVGYALCYAVVDFVFGGIYACTTLAVSRWFDNRFGAVCFPLLLQCALVYGVDSLWIESRSFNPAFYINPSHSSFSLYCSIPRMLLLFVIMLAVLIVLYIIGNARRDAIDRR